MPCAYVFTQLGSIIVYCAIAASWYAIMVDLQNIHSNDADGLVLGDGSVTECI